MAQTLSPGQAAGELVILDEPLSFWGGFDADTGHVTDQRHPQVGLALTGRVLAMEQGRGSSSGSSVLAEAIRAGTAPCAILLLARDEIIALGAIVADEVYGVQMPVVLIDEAEWDGLRSDKRLVVSAPNAGTPTIVVDETISPQKDDSWT
jgi:predicted aconitase with swiveling domain